MCLVLYIARYLQPDACQTVEYFLINVRGYFSAFSIEIIMFPNATSYMLTSFGFAY